MEPVTGKCTICMKWVSRWPANYKTIAGNRRMQPVTGEMTWSGFLATHKEKQMVASTIFEKSSSGQKRVPIFDQQIIVENNLTRQK